MRVGVCLPAVTPAWGGAYTFVTNLVGALARSTSAHEFVVVHRGDAPPVPHGALPAVPLAAPSSPLESTLGAAVREARLDLVWFPTPDYEPVEAPFVATVWDLEHRNQPWFPEVSFAGWDWDERELFYRSTLPRATLVLAGSEEGRRQIREYYGVPEARVAVAPFPAPAFAAAELEPVDLAAELGELPRPFLFYPAQFWPHKNHAALLLAVKRLEQAGLRLGAVFTGTDQGNLAHVEATVAELGLRDRVRFLGFVERRTLVALYREALALAFPSFFGPDNLPPLEAFALGCPVVAAAVPGAVERLGDAALLFDPKSEQELADAVRRLHDDAALRGELVRRGHARNASWSGEDYVATVSARLDEFEAIRRCWSRSEPFVHR
jgi:glycosyltransferase involved in cell wall biosynthesis